LSAFGRSAKSTKVRFVRGGRAATGRERRANIFDEIAEGQQGAVQEILNIYHEEDVTLLLPDSVQAELKDANTPESAREISQQFIYSVEVTLDRNRERAIRMIAE
jgi:hypothetical protein